jgi:hypothetical protein
MPWVLLTLACVAWLWAARGWQKRTGTTLISRGAALLCIGFSLLDWGLLSALRPLRVSFGPTGMALAILAVMRLFLSASLVFSQRKDARHAERPMRSRGVEAGERPSTRLRRSGRPPWTKAQGAPLPGSSVNSTTFTFWGCRVSRPAVTGLAVLLALNLGLLALVADGFYIEPQSLSVTELTVPGPALVPGRPLRIVHLTDLHIERLTQHERDLVARVAALQPDLIVLTGDYLNQEYLEDPVSRAATREVLAQFHAPQGVYAVRGTIDPPEVMAALFNGLDITVLNDEVRRVSLAEGDLYLVGVADLQWSRGMEGDAAALQRLAQGVPSGGYTLLLYHTPDLVETASAAGINLYLAGHTHGGQIRLPFYGALITFSAYGRRYQMGQYRVGATTLYVSRGIGMEGLQLPRVRILCLPEVDVISLAAGL